MAQVIPGEDRMTLKKLNDPSLKGLVIRQEAQTAE
jgi:hypothetical protein